MNPCRRAGIYVMISTGLHNVKRCSAMHSEHMRAPSQTEACTKQGNQQPPTGGSSQADDASTAMHCTAQCACNPMHAFVAKAVRATSSTSRDMSSRCSHHTPTTPRQRMHNTSATHAQQNLPPPTQSSSAVVQCCQAAKQMLRPKWCVTNTTHTWPK